MSNPYRVTPIDVWPGQPTNERKRALFKCDYHRTHRLLKFELLKIGAHNVTLRLALPASQIRVDGQPFANARPQHPGVILCFDSRQGAISMPCDTFNEWLANLHAIAVALEDLRRISRYGVGRSEGGNAQYKGWQQIAAPIEQWSKEAAYEFVRKLMGLQDVPRTRDQIEELIRAAEKRTHPDMGGNPDHFKRVQLARKLLLS